MYVFIAFQRSSAVAPNLLVDHSIHSCLGFKNYMESESVVGFINLSMLVGVIFFSKSFNVFEHSLDSQDDGSGCYSL